METPPFAGFQEDWEEEELYRESVFGKMGAKLRRLESEGDKMRVEMSKFRQELKVIKDQNMEEGTHYQMIKDLKQELENLRKERENREEENGELKKEMAKLKKENELNGKLLLELKKENEALKRSCDKGESTVKEQVQSIMKDEVKIWKEESEREKVSFRQVLKEQQKESDANIEKKVVGVIKNKPRLVRDTVEKKKCIIMYGMKEIKKSTKFLRERDEVKKAKEVIASLNNEEEDERYEEEIEEVYRLGRFKQGENRPLKVRFRSQAEAEELLYRAGRLSKTEEYKDIWLKRDLTEEERNRKRELSQCAKERNEERSEEEKKEFFWRVLDLRLVKWIIRK